MSRLTPDQVRQVFEPVFLREARDRIDSLFEVCRLLGAEPAGQDIETIHAALTKALVDRGSVLAEPAQRTSMSDQRGPAQ